jgi:peptide/nickel transport system permease protein
VSGYSGSATEKLKDLLLPSLTIALYLAPMLIRTLRSSVIDVLDSDFVEAARARGLSERRVIAKHVLRNASIATVTVLAVNLGFLISGTVVIEVVFNIPGLGSLIVSAVQTRDFPVVQALTLIFGAIVIAVSLMADVAYAVIDPRVREASAR